MSDVNKVCQCHACERVDYLHAKEAAYGRRERMAVAARDYRAAERYSHARTNALDMAERRLKECKDEGPWREFVTLPEDKVLGATRQRAEIIGRHPKKSMITVRIVEADREEGDPDGLTEVPFCCRCDRLVSGDPTAEFICSVCEDKEPEPAHLQSQVQQKPGPVGPSDEE